MSVEGQPAGGDGPAQSDEALIERYYCGDDDAFEEIDRRYRLKLYRHAVKLGLNEHDAEACAQESLAKVSVSKRKKILSIAGAYDQRQAKFGTWLYRLHHNTCMDALRRRGVSLRLFESAGAADDDDAPPAALEQLPSPDKLPDQAVADKEMKRHLEAALEDLPTEHRLVVELCFGLEDKSIEAAGPQTLQQVAAILGTSAPTVYRRRREALVMLRKALIERGVTAPAPAGDGEPLRRIGNV